MTEHTLASCLDAMLDWHKPICESHATGRGGHDPCYDCYQVSQAHSEAQAALNALPVLRWEPFGDAEDNDWRASVDGGWTLCVLHDGYWHVKFRWQKSYGMHGREQSGEHAVRDAKLRAEQALRDVHVGFRTVTP